MAPSVGYPDWAPDDGDPALPSSGAAPHDHIDALSADCQETQPALFAFQDAAKVTAMPYRARGRWIQVKRRGKWVRYRRARSAASAKARATAMNLAHARKGRG